MNKKCFFKIRFMPDRLFFISIPIAVVFLVLCASDVLNITTSKYIILALIFLGCSLVRLEINECVTFNILLPLIHSFAVTLIIQVMEGTSPFNMGLWNLVANIILNAGITYLFLLLTNRIKPALTMSHILLIGFTFIDFLVKTFRGGVNIKISDFYSINTAISVANQYKIELTTQVTTGLMLGIVMLYIFGITKINQPLRKTQKPRICASICLTLSVLSVFICLNTLENHLYSWGSSGAKYNGLTYNLLIEAKNCRVEIPEGYSDEKATEILSAYKPQITKKEFPHIIVIMSEAFSDLNVLGDFSTNKNPLEYYYSLEENCTKGYLISSVFGGNTATSEWEFLTGNTQAFLPPDSVAYQQYVKENPNTVLDILKNHGYTTIAMHPYKIGGWKRNIVYKHFGFDELYFDQELSKDILLRKYISDETFFGDIIKRFESRKENEKLFTFAITMQNHGGYKTNLIEPEVTIDGINAPDTEQYLSLIHKSDAALKKLITYFENCNEKVMLVFFGDHQPILDDEFYSKVIDSSLSTYEKDILKRIVPFTIWTNYDTEEVEDVYTSINYLSVMMLKKAGIGLNPYFSYLENLENEINVISAQGYLSKEQKKYLPIDSAKGHELELINQYKTVQYKNIFKNNKQ